MKEPQPSDTVRQPARLMATPGDGVLLKCSCGSKLHATVHVAQDGGMAMFISASLFERHKQHSKTAVKVVPYYRAPSPVRTVVESDSTKVGS